MTADFRSIWAQLSSEKTPLRAHRVMSLTLIMGLVLGFAGGLSHAQTAEPAIPETAAVPGAIKLKMDFSIVCEDGSATISLVNKGVSWPKAGNLEVYNLKDNTVLSKRTIRITKDQKVSFRIKGANNKQIGLWIAPSWYQRDENNLRYDAVVSCQ